MQKRSDGLFPRPCPWCGAEPKLRRTQIAGLNCSVKMFVYSCSCLEREEERIRAEEERDRRMRRLLSSGVPLRYHQADLKPHGSSPYEDKLLPLCRDFVYNYRPGRGLGLIGSVGTGKTYYLSAILLAFLQQNRQCLFLNVTDFFDLLKSSFNNYGNTGPHKGLLRLAKEAEIVAFDDIGAEYGTQWTQGELSKVINARYNNNLTTLFSSNLSPEDLATRCGARCIDRLREMCRVIIIDGESVRGTEMRKRKK